ncbi:bifunctional isopimaradiene synthase, chloroplastic-like [Zingiber officinale]|nr:bifunctional isopimaradiene synthase, chloroplastic-like [Zingiber officinale]
MEMYMKLRETKLGGQSGEYSLKDYIEHGKTELGVAVRLLPSVFLMGERLRDLDLLCLNEKSRIQEKLSVFLRLYVDLQMHKNSLAQGGMNAVAVSMEVGKRREEEALGDVEAQMEEAFDELVHESLKPSLVPRSCRRLMFEHARITQFFLHDDFTSPAHRLKIAEAMERFRTPVPIDSTA